MSCRTCVTGQQQLKCSTSKQTNKQTNRETKKEQEGGVDSPTALANGQPDRVIRNPNTNENELKADCQRRHREGG